METALAQELWSDMFSSNTRLTYIAAPAGYGKTALLRALQQRSADDSIDNAVIDCRDVDSSNWNAISSCLRPAEQPCRKLVLIDNADESGELLMPSRLLSAIGPSSHIRCVVASKSLPKDNWLALQLSEDLRVLRSDDLRLRPQDVAVMLEQYSGRAVPPGAALRIDELTEGWPLAVQLCGFAARRNADWFSVIKDTLEHAIDLNTYFDQVLRPLSKSLREFLMAAAPLDRFCAGLCRDVLQGLDGDALQSEAIDLNLFVVPDRQAGWYRFHRAFRHYLNRRSREGERNETRSTLKKARDWCFLHNQESQSIEYSLRIGDFPDAERTLLRSVSTCVANSCQLDDVIRWTEAIERASGVSPLTLRLWKIAALVFSMRLVEARSECKLIEKSRNFTRQLRNEPGLAMRFDQLRVSIAIKSDEFSEATAAGRAWLDRYDSAPAFHRGAVVLALAAAWFTRSQTANYLKYLNDAKQIASIADSAYVHGWVSTLEILGELAGGYIDSAQRLADHAVDAARRTMDDDCPMVGTLSLLAARALCEKGLFERARAHLARGLPHIGDHGLIETAVAGLEAAVATTEARFGCAQALAEIRLHLLACARFAPRLQVEAARIVVLLLLRHGDIAGARREFDLRLSRSAMTEIMEHSDPIAQDEMSKTCRFVEAVVLLAERNYPGVLSVCGGLLPSTDFEGRSRRHVELRILRAAALLGTGSEREACRYLTCALGTAASRGYMQTLCDLNWAVGAMIDRIKRPTAPEFILELRRRLGKAPLNADQPASNQVDSERLTQREVEILQSLDSGLTNEDVAKSLHLSLATVKWHLRNVYMKLAVANRSGALSKARRTGQLGGIVA